MCGTARVSVLLPVLNGMPELAKSMQSVLSQDVPDLELIVVNDGSTDGTGEYLSAIAETDSRVHVIRHATCCGIAQSLNEAAAIAHGDVLARIDSGDQYLPGKLSRQLAYLERRPKLALVSTWAEAVNLDGTVVPCSYMEHLELAGPRLHTRLLCGNRIVHGTVMMRRRIFEELGGYSTLLETDCAEDYELWLRMVRMYEIADVSQVLYRYVLDPVKSVVRTRIQRAHEATCHVQGRALREVAAGRPLVCHLLDNGEMSNPAGVLHAIRLRSSAVHYVLVPHGVEAPPESIERFIQADSSVHVAWGTEGSPMDAWTTLLSYTDEIEAQRSLYGWLERRMLASVSWRNSSRSPALVRYCGHLL